MASVCFTGEEEESALEILSITSRAPSEQIPPAMSAAGESELKNDNPADDDSVPESTPEVTVTSDADRQEPVPEPDPDPEATATESVADGPKSVPEPEPGVTVTRDADPSPEIVPPEPEDPPLVRRPEVTMGEGSRSFTMRELLNGDDYASNGIVSDAGRERKEVGSTYSQEGSEPRFAEQENTAMELIDSVTGVDEEGRSRQRILVYAAQRYASAITRNPGDYDALYNWALVLQESADNVSAESTSPSKDALLEEACKKYDQATRLCPTLHDAFYNWAIAISDRAKMRGRTREAEEFWKQATKNYEKAVQLNWNSPQALNNWGLALQELSAIVPAREKQTIVKTAVSKFRVAIQLQFDFHRAIYNLGTVLYGLAEDTLRMVGATNAKEVSPNELYSQSAIYIAAAHSLKPSYSVYSSALKLVRSMLPLPCLKVGYLMAPPVGSQVAPHSDWRRSQFILNHESLQQVSGLDKKQATQGLRSGDFANSDKRTVKVNIPDITSASACSDLTLPPGAGLGIDTIRGPVFLVADSWESLDGWLDAIRLVYTIYARGKSDVLAGIITG